MDLISMIVMALVTGAAAALKPTAEQIVKDRYAGIKGLILSKYGSVGPDVTMLETDPASKKWQELIKESLEKTDAGQDEKLLRDAQALLNAVQTHAPDVPRTVSIDLKDIKVATSINIGKLLAEGNATAFRAERLEANSLSFGDVEARSREDTPPKNRWGDPISDERKAELVVLEQEWEGGSDHLDRLSAFTWKQLTGADVFWLAARARVGPGGDIAAAERELRSARTEARGRSLGIPPLNLGGADLSQTHLEEASLHHTNLKNVYFSWAHLEGADFYKAHLEQANFYGAYLEGTIFEEAHLEEAYFREAHLEQAYFLEAHLERATLSLTHLEDADLRRAHLEGAIFEEEAHLERAFLDGVYLEGADLSKAHLEDTHLRGAFFNAATILPHRFWANKQHVGPWLADVHWGDVNLTVVDWEPLAVLADEDEARQLKRRSGGQKSEDTQLDKYQAAVRANRLLAVALLEQGLNEHAAHFAYHAQILQRKVLGLQLRRERKGLKWSRKLGQYLFSWFLYLLGGYGYRMWRIFAAYAIAVALAALAYFILGAQGYGPHLRWDEAFLVSITAFHGRVFAEQFGFATPQMWITAGEAVLGLLIESVFIAMLVQRFFGK